METESLHFQPISPKHFLALIEEPDSFQQLVGWRAAEGLRGFIVSDDVPPEFIASLKRATEPDPWRWGFFVVHQAAALVIGTAAFKGPPDENGVVEIAYGIVPAFENQGYATIAAGRLVAFARVDSRVRTVLAHTLPQPNASTRVLEKNGFEKVGEVTDPEDGLVWRWRHVEVV